MKLTKTKINARTENFIQVPKPFDKYYRLASDEEIAEYNGVELDMVRPTPCEEAEGYDVKNLWYLIAKPQYLDELANNGLDQVELVSENDGAPQVVYYAASRIYPVSIEEIESCCGFENEIESCDNIQASEDLDDNFDEVEYFYSDDVVAGIAAKLSVPRNIAEMIYEWYDAEGALEDFDNVRDFLDYVEGDIWDMLDACDDEYIREEVEDALNRDIEASTSTDICAKTWMGKYKNLSGEVKKVYFDYETSDFEEAEEYFFDTIPEAYVKAKLLGSAPSTSLAERDGFTCMNCSSDIEAAIDTGLEYWYFTTHGFGPGTIPNGVSVLDTYEEGYDTWIKLNKMLTTKELNYYDLKEQWPPEGVTTHNGDVIAACNTIEATDDIKAGNRLEQYQKATERSVYPGGKAPSMFYKGYKLVFDNVAKLWDIIDKANRVIQGGFEDKNDAIDYISNSLVAASTNINASDDIDAEYERFKMLAYSDDYLDSYDQSTPLIGWYWAVGKADDDEGYEWRCFTDGNWDLIKYMSNEEIYNTYPVSPENFNSGHLIVTGDRKIIDTDTNEIIGYADEVNQTNFPVEGCSDIVEGATAEEAQQAIDEYMAKQAEMCKQLDDLQENVKKKSGLFGRRRKANSSEVHLVEETDDNLEYVVSSEEIEGMSLVNYKNYRMIADPNVGGWDVFTKDHDLIKSGFRSEAAAKKFIDGLTEDIEGTTEVEAETYEIPRSLLDPDFIDPPYEEPVGDKDPLKIEFDFDFVVDVFNDTSWAPADGEDPFYDVEDYTEDGVDKDRLEEDFFDMLLWYIPSEEGKYRVKGTAKLEYDYDNELDIYPRFKSRYSTISNVETSNAGKVGSLTEASTGIDADNTVEGTTDITAAMTEDELDNAILHDKTFDLNDFKEYKMPEGSDMLKGRDIEVDDIIDVEADASEVNLGTVVKVVAINDPAEDWIDFTFKCEVLDDVGQSDPGEQELKPGDFIDLHFDADEEIGYLLPM